MAWTLPKTMTAGTVMTAADWNTYLRDNLAETAPGKTSLGTGTGGRYYVAADDNELVERVLSSALVSTAQSTASTTYASLATSGPAVTITTGAMALVMINARLTNGTGTVTSHASVEVSGATTLAANDDWSISHRSPTAGNVARFGRHVLFETLTPGVNTFRMMYRTATGGTCTAANRHIIVVPL